MNNVIHYQDENEPSYSALAPMKEINGTLTATSSEVWPLSNKCREEEHRRKKAGRSPACSLLKTCWGDSYHEEDGPSLK